MSEHKPGIGSPKFRAFSRLFLELDGDSHEQPREVTLACIEALFDRVACAPMLDADEPTLDDVDGAEAELVRMIREEAERTREFIRSRRPEA